MYKLKKNFSSLQEQQGVRAVERLYKQLKPVALSACCWQSFATRSQHFIEGVALVA